MKITPKTEEELSSFELLSPGEYPFTVLASDEVASKSAKNKGKMMFSVKLNVHGPDGDRHVYTYFADWFSEWLLKHFADTTGQSAAYERGDLDGRQDAFAGKTGYVKVAIEQGVGSYPDKNIVKDFIVKGEAKAAAPSAPPDDDDVSFEDLVP